MPTDRQLQAMNALHRGVLALTRRRVGARVGGMPVLELTTTGRRSGRRHRVLLTSPVQTSRAIVVVASRGGDDRHPDWYLNLRANPRVEVAFSGHPARSMRSRVATLDEREDLWGRVTAAFGGYATYQERTAREIPLVLLEAPDGGQLCV